MVNNSLPEIQKRVDRIFGMDRPSSWSNQTCIAPPIGCGKPITGFHDVLSEREYGISGMCQNCQDEFEEMYDEDED